MHAERSSAWKPIAGPVLFWCGLLVLGMALMDAMHTLPWSMPRFWYLLRPGCLLVALISLIAGANLLWGTTQRRSSLSDEDEDDDDEGDID